MNPAVTTVILAGGRGTRLGGIIKANLRIGNKTLLAMVKERVVGQGGRVLLSTGRFSEADFETEGMICASDPAGVDMGPVGGLVAAINWSAQHAPDTTFLFTTAVDTPFVPRDFVERALPLMQPEIDAVHAQAGEQNYPTNALWRRDALASLPENVLSGGFSGGLRDIIPKIRTAMLSYPVIDGRHPFENINTAQDYARIRKRRPDSAD